MPTAQPSTISTTHLHHTRLKQLSQFFSAYGTALLSAGATAHRIKEGIERMAPVYNAKVECSVLPARVMLTVWDLDEDHSYSQVGRTRSAGINLYTSAALDALSHQVATSRLSLSEAEEALQDITSRKRMSPWIVTPLVGLANASFCRLFGGDVVSMGIVFGATVEGFALKNWLLQRGMDGRIVTFLAALAAAIVASAGYIFHLGSTPQLALATSVLYLVPGIPYLNSITDLLTGHHLNAVSRFIDAIVTTMCLSLGLCVAMLLTEISYN